LTVEMIEPCLNIKNLANNTTYKFRTEFPLFKSISKQKEHDYFVLFRAFRGYFIIIISRFFRGSNPITRVQ
ncbi:MAG: hypothetical protein K6E86_09720, partial [Bacteroidales bacterium]|nr:hypothetical protein [Bacteroidales bacterium]